MFFSKRHPNKKAGVLVSGHPGRPLDPPLIFSHHQFLHKRRLRQRNSFSVWYISQRLVVIDAAAHAQLVLELSVIGFQNSQHVYVEHNICV